MCGCTNSHPGYGSLQKLGASTAKYKWTDTKKRGTWINCRIYCSEILAGRGDRDEVEVMQTAAERRQQKSFNESTIIKMKAARQTLWTVRQEKETLTL